MIIACEKCHTRFQLDDPRIYNRSLKVQCSKCDHVFIVPPVADEGGERIERAVVTEPSVEEPPEEPRVEDHPEDNEEEVFEQSLHESEGSSEEEIAAGAQEEPSGPAQDAVTEDTTMDPEQESGSAEEEEAMTAGLAHDTEDIESEDADLEETKENPNASEPSPGEPEAEESAKKEIAEIPLSTLQFLPVEDDDDVPPEPAVNDTGPGNEEETQTGSFDLNFADEEGPEPPAEDTEQPSGLYGDETIEESGPDVEAEAVEQGPAEENRDEDTALDFDDSDEDEAAEEIPTGEPVVDSPLDGDEEEAAVDLPPEDTLTTDAADAADVADAAGPESPASAPEPTPPDTPVIEGDAEEDSDEDVPEVDMEAGEAIIHPLEGMDALDTEDLSLNLPDAGEPQPPEEITETEPPAEVQLNATEVSRVFDTSAPEPEEEEVTSGPPPGRGRSYVAVVILAFLAGAALYIAGVSGVIPGLTTGGTVKGTTVDIAELKGFYIANKNLGKIFVIETRLKNLTEGPQRIGGVRGKIYSRWGKVMGSRTVSPGRVVSAGALNNLSGKDLVRIFKDTSGGTLPPGGTVPVMVIFTDLPRAVSEYGIEVMR